MQAPASGKQDLFHLECKLEMWSAVQPLFAHQCHHRRDALVRRYNRTPVTGDAPLPLEFYAHQLRQISTGIYLNSGAGQKLTGTQVNTASIDLRLGNSLCGGHTET